MRPRYGQYLLSLGPVLLVVACGASGGGDDGRRKGGGGNPPGQEVGADGSDGSAGSPGSTGSLGSTGSILGGDASLGTSPANENPCELPDPPPECSLVPSGPACGDGKLNQDGEQCDDGNSLPGDGCSGVCTKESYFECPTEGKPCVSTIICGDGVVGAGEACDDRNQNDKDGCSARCNLVEPGYSCRKPGEPCRKLQICGNGEVDPSEGCDDGNTKSDDGCDSKCRIEFGFNCTGQPSKCTPTTCGDKKTEGAESCDDGNRVPFDGCGANCQAEPDCKKGACSSSCGDGIVLGEECDDGNLRDGDGCSSECKVELGYKCNNDAGNCGRTDGSCSLGVTVVYRDFSQNKAAKGHPDFQPPNNNEDGPITGLVKASLDADGKPEWSGQTNGFIRSADSYRQWYRSVSGVNSTYVRELTLWENGKGGFVNRWGENGEQWIKYTNPTPCINRSGDCSNTSLCVVVPGTVCAQPCPLNSERACILEVTPYDGNPVFFPIDDPKDLIADERYPAQISIPYGNWIDEPGGKSHNFHFTSEVKYWFKYDPKVNARLDFTGDDDVWVFVNNKLALDLGGWHTPADGSVVLDAAAGTKYGLTEGNVYPIVVFQAERMTKASTFRLTLSGFNLAPSDCTTDCGDGQQAPGEECDDGPNNLGGYNQCSPTCTLGPRCGDGVKQEQFGEACDDGVNNNAWGGCAPDCQPGPHCGDGIVQPEFEKCDDGANSGEYGKCAPGCVLGARCGDGNVNLPFEECDDGNNVSHDGCSSACKDEIHVAR